MNLRTLRLAGASLLSMGAILCTGIVDTPDAAVGWLLVGAPFLAAALIWVPRLEAQLLSRAILWAYLFWATFGSWVIDEGGGDPARVLLSLGLGSAGALLLVPKDGLEQKAVSERFVPVAFRSVIVLILILAMTDTLVLGTNLLVHVEDRWVRDPAALGFFGAGTVAMGAAVFGLLRMRAWGFALNLVTNVGVAVVSWCLDDMPWQLALGLTTTAVLQLLVGLPLARRIASPGAADPSPLLARLGRASLGLMVVALVAGRAFHA